MTGHLPFNVSGSSVTLTAGPYQATILTCGAALSSLSLNDLPLTVPYTSHDLAPGFGGMVLLPWPNRIREGQYSWGGTSYQLPINDIGTRTALHGTVYNRHWSILSVTPNSATLECWIPGMEGYPWPLHSQVSYHLNERSGLTATITTRNLCSVDIPYGVGTHPYLAPGGGVVDDWTLQMAPSHALRMDASLLPCGLVPVSEIGLDFALPRSLSGISIDTGFTSFPSTPWAIHVENPLIGLRATLSSCAPWVQIYTGDGIDRQGIAVEPMSCPTNAFNDAHDSIVLSAGQSHYFSWSISGQLIGSFDKRPVEPV